jgi:cell division protein ZapA
VPQDLGRADGPSPSAAGREKRVLKLELLGRQLTVRSDDDEAYVRQIVDFVNHRLLEIKRSSGRVETEQIALLAALDLADALFRERQESEALKSAIREGSHRLLNSIDALEAELGEPELELAEERRPRVGERVL